MNPLIFTLSKPFRLISTGSFPRRLGDGVSLPPWSWQVGAVATIASLVSYSAVRKLLEILWGLRPTDVLFPALVFSIPTLCCLVYLARRAGTTVGHLFGLRGTRVTAVLGSGILLFLLEMLLGIGTGAVLICLGCQPQPDTTVTSAFETVDMIVWAPICEELTFRGLLYTSLRTRLGVAPSAIFTAAVFALCHTHYSADVMTVLFVQALLSSLWYERTGSLWPNVVSHSLTNLL